MRASKVNVLNGDWPAGFVGLKVKRWSNASSSLDTESVEPNHRTTDLRLWECLS